MIFSPWLGQLSLAGASSGPLEGPFADTWDIANSSPLLTFSNADRRFVYVTLSSSVPAAAKAMGTRTLGKYYFEILVTAFGNGGQIGLTSNSYTAPTTGGFWCNVSAHAPSSGANGVIYEFGLTTHTVAPGTIHAFAIDFDTGKVWYAANNSWYNSGDPAAGTGYLWQFNVSDLLANPLCPYGNFQGHFGDPDVTIKDSTSQLTYTPPSGFSAWAGT